jgi:hypothetical protein
LGLLGRDELVRIANYQQGRGVARAYVGEGRHLPANRLALLGSVMSWNELVVESRREKANAP